MRRILALMIALAMLPAASALTPPTNIWGYATIGDSGLHEGSLIELWGDCYGNGPELIVTAQTQVFGGYYDIDVPMDDPNTNEDEGCTSGSLVAFRIGGVETIALTLLGGGSSVNINQSLPAPVRENPDDGSGGSGGSSGGAPLILTEPNEILVLGDPAAPPLDAVPPFNVFGYVYVNGVLAEGGSKVEIIADCYGTEEVIADGEVMVGTGYYDIYIDMDSPNTEEDEGCESGDIIRFRVDNVNVDSPSHLSISGSGKAINEDLLIGAALPPEEESPAETIGSDAVNRNTDWIFVAGLLLIVAAASLLSIHFHRRHEKRP